MVLLSVLLPKRMNEYPDIRRKKMYVKNFKFHAIYVNIAKISITHLRHDYIVLIQIKRKIQKSQINNWNAF